MNRSDISTTIDKTALEILAMSIGSVLGEQSKIHNFVKIAAERPSSINIDRAHRTFDALPVYQRKRVAETAEGNAFRQRGNPSLAAILNRLGHKVAWK
jgi:hypothetical protein